MTFEDYWEIREHEVKIQNLEDEISELLERVNNLECENYDLTREIDELMRGDE